MWIYLIGWTAFKQRCSPIRLTRLHGWNVARAGRAAHHTELLECSSYSCHRIFPIQRAYVLDTLTRDLIRRRSITSCALSPQVRPDGNSRRIELRWDRRFARSLIQLDRESTK